MNVTASLLDVQYTPLVYSHLKSINIQQLNINAAPPSFQVSNGVFQAAVSKWVSPKRTRSYPFQRVYETLCHSTRIAVIPIVKDEGIDGARDFLQWDTISLLSLLNVYVIVAFHVAATPTTRNQNKLYNPQFDADFIHDKLRELQYYVSSPRAWNMNEIMNFHRTVAYAIESYRTMSEQYDITFHREDELTNYAQQMQKSAQEFLLQSRKKSRKAQEREIAGVQPNERLRVGSQKGKLLITDTNGGEYNLTCDEVQLNGSELFLIEAKHSSTALIPHESDVKDALLKMMLYTNLRSVQAEGKARNAIPVIKLTSPKIIGSITSTCSQTEWHDFLLKHNFSKRQTEFYTLLRTEATLNKFRVQLEHAD